MARPVFAVAGLCVALLLVGGADAAGRMLAQSNKPACTYCTYGTITSKDNPNVRACYMGSSTYGGCGYGGKSYTWCWMASATDINNYQKPDSAGKCPMGSYNSGGTCWGYCNYGYGSTPAPDGYQSCSNACSPDNTCGTSTGWCQSYYCGDAKGNLATPAVASLACPTATLNTNLGYNQKCSLPAPLPTCSPPPPPSPSPPPPPMPPPPPVLPAGVATCASYTGMSSKVTPVLNLQLGVTPMPVTAYCTVTLTAGQFLTFGAGAPGSSCSGSTFTSVLSSNTGPALISSGTFNGVCSTVQWTALYTGQYILATGCYSTNDNCAFNVNYQVQAGTWENLMSPLKSPYPAPAKGVYYGQCSKTAGMDNTGMVAGSAVFSNPGMPLNAGNYWMNPGIVVTPGKFLPIPTASETWSLTAYCKGQPGSFRIGTAVGTGGTVAACYDYSGNICKPGALNCGCDYALTSTGAAKSNATNTQKQTANGMIPWPSNGSWNCLVCPP